MKKIKFSQTIGLIAILFLFSSCKEYLAAATFLAIIPEIIFGGLLTVFLIVGVIGLIIHLISGGDNK